MAPNRVASQEDFKVRPLVSSFPKIIDFICNRELFKASVKFKEALKKGRGYSKMHWKIYGLNENQLVCKRELGYKKSGGSHLVVRTNINLRPQKLFLHRNHNLIWLPCRGNSVPQYWSKQ